MGPHSDESITLVTISLGGMCDYTTRLQSAANLRGGHMVTLSSASAPRAISSAERVQFHRDGFLAIHEAWNHASVTEAGQVIDGLYQSVSRECGALPNLIRREPRLRETAVFRTCCRIAKQIMGRSARIACDNAL